MPSQQRNAPAGILLLDKPAGVTSFNALGSVKRELKTTRVGHAGTLDKFATGLLLVMCGYATRLVQYSTQLSKTYSAVVRFGVTTDTLDPEGLTTGTGPIPAQDTLESVLKRFRGTTEQIPPVYSAVHVDGERAYKRARRGEKVTVKPRTVEIYRLQVTRFSPPETEIRVECSGGTYIRSLARDIGEACGTVAYVRRLRRSAIGQFRVEDAVPPGKVKVEDVRDVRDLFANHPEVAMAGVDEWTAERVRHGKQLRPAELQTDTVRDGPVALFGPDGAFLAVVECRSERCNYRVVRPQPNPAR